MENCDMNTIAINESRDCFNSLGIPVDNLSLEDTVAAVVRMAKTRDGKSRLVSTLNVDFLVNSLGYAFNRARHPELLDVLRNSDLVTADGFPIVWLSRIMGKPLKQRVTGSDMTPALAKLAAKEKLSLFLLGGATGVAAKAACALQESNPGLTIAGTSAPFVHIDGEKLKDFAQDDARVLQQLNDSGADILLVGLGNPKQELWFNRNRHKLQVPVAIGVGGTFEFITGSVKRAPEWSRRLNLEWLYRITQDPGRLWRRYATGMFKLSAMTAPLLYYRIKQELLFRLPKPADIIAPRWKSIWSSRDQSLSLLQLPRVITEDYLEIVLKTLEQTSSGFAMRLLDFSDVKHVHFTAHYAFFRLARLLQEGKGDISILGMRKSLQRELAASRILDMVNDSDGDTLGMLSVGDGLAPTQGTGCRSYVMSETTLIYLSGVVSAASLEQLGFAEILQHALRGRTCIVDLRGVALLESSAIVALQPIITAQHEQRAGAFLVSGADSSARQMFRMTRLDADVLLIDDATLVASIAAEGKYCE
ncbi:MAG: N-acetylglucosaminyldiphosphoundecaprenol N-acetyl-beta-D-mannosaminyltransferase [Halioglobus sp.]